MRSKRSHSGTHETDEEIEVSGKVVGTVRRHIPIDTRDPFGATLHFYVGDSYDSSRLVFFCLKYKTCATGSLSMLVANVIISFSYVQEG